MCEREQIIWFEMIEKGGIDGVKAELEQHVNSGTECQQCIFLLFQIEFM